ncbi:CD44 antigen isoform X2 [Rhineura floridana]|uniref:CD44 antigen isoform X2 n=1 Tax=Rhineura floridana TaxID=261503 RepID=UPI002AC810E9|nr:CD44 antigen isoform X2 [Rhineura floridana]
MAKFWLCAAVGFYLLQLSLAQIGLNISCRYAGVFHVEKNHRYSLSKDEAIELCKALNSTIPTWDQMEKAFELGFETCRYGYIEDKIVIPRQTPYHLCAANNTGIYILMSNISDKYDAYCFNASETRLKVCDPVTKLYSVWPDEDSQIEIFNADGSRYIEGQKFTERPPVTDDDTGVGSGSANDRGTTDPSIIRPGISSHYPHPADDVASTFTSNHFDEEDEYRTYGPGIHDDHNERDHSKDQHPESTNLDLHKKQEDSAQEHNTPGFEGDKYDRKVQLSPSITVSPHHSSHEETSTQHQRNYSVLLSSIDYKEVQHPTEGTWDESSEENDDDGGGDDDEDDHNEEGSGHINPETVLEWNSSGDKEPQPSDTTVVSIKDVKHEDSAHDSFLHGVPSGKDNEVQYSTNGTREDVPPRIVPLGDDDHNSTATAVSSSDDYFKQEDSTQNPLDGAHSGLETEDIVPTTTTSHVLHPGLVPSSERERTLEEEPFHRTADVVSNDGVKYEESTQGPPPHAMYPEWFMEERYSTNSSSKDTLPEIIPPSENDQKNESIYTVMISTGDNNHEDSPHHTLRNVLRPIWSNEDRHPTNTSRDGVLPDIISSSESKHETDLETSHTAVVSSDSTHSEDSTHDTMLHGEHSEWNNEEKHLTNTSGDHLLPGIIHPAESEHENDHSKTAVASSDNGKQEDSTQKPLWHGMHPGQGSEDEDTMNTTMDTVPSGIPPSERKHETETYHTAVVSNGGSDHEDSTQDLLTQEPHPDQNREHRHPANTTVDDFVPRIPPSVENAHEKETSHTAVSSNDDIKHGDATHDPTVHDTHHEWDREDKHPTNSTKDEVPIEIIPATGNNNKEEISHTAVIHNDPEDSTQQPLPPVHQPGWDTEEKYPMNTSRDDILMGAGSNSESEHNPLHTDVVYDGTKEDSTPEPVRQWGSEDKYTTKSTADVLFPGIVPRRGINQKNNTDHTVIVSSDGSQTEESTQDPQLYGLHPGWSSEDEHLVNNTRDYVIPGAFPETDSGSDRHSSSPTASSDPDEHGNGSHEGRQNVIPGESPKNQRRMAHIPDWLIVVASLLALALILGVCIAVNSRRRCGQKQKLVINNGKGGIDDKNMGGLNGEASKSQEMVHLVHKEKPGDQTGPHDEFLAVDETQNQQDVALKSGM